MRSWVMAALLVLAACSGSRTPESRAVAANAAAMEQALADRARELEAIADNQADQNAADAIQGAADELHEQQGNVADAARDAQRNLR